MATMYCTYDDLIAQVSEKVLLDQADMTRPPPSYDINVDDNEVIDPDERQPDPPVYSPPEMDADTPHTDTEETERTETDTTDTPPGENGEGTINGEEENGESTDQPDSGIALAGTEIIYMDGALDPDRPPEYSDYADTLHPKETDFIIPDIQVMPEPEPLPGPVVERDNITPAIINASAEITGYLNRRYALPNNPKETPATLRKLCVDIAIFNVFSRKGFGFSDNFGDSIIYKRYENAIAYLKMLAEGDGDIGDAEEEPKGDGDTAEEEDMDDWKRHSKGAYIALYRS